MTTPVFEFPVLANDTGTKEYIVRTAQFGDGYAQVSGEGINSSKRSWNVSYAGKKEDVALVADFLDERSGYKSFIWKDPTGKFGLYRSKDHQILNYSSEVQRLTTVFEEAFAP